MNVPRETKNEEKNEQLNIIYKKSFRHIMF
jgi:hypothetical protein